MFIAGAIREGRNLGIGNCFIAPLGHPWPVPRFILGASHEKSVRPPQSPVEFTVLFELQFTLFLREKPEKYIVMASVAICYIAYKSEFVACLSVMPQM